MKDFKMRIFFAARLEPVKNPILLIEAAKQLPDYEFIIAGDGSLYEECKRLANGFNNIKLGGWVEPKNVSKLMEETDVFCQLDNIENIWSSALIAAMKYGKAIICTETIYSSKYLREDYHVMFVSPHGSTSELVHAIKKLENNIEFRLSLGKNAQQFVQENLSVEKITSKIRQLLRDEVE